MFGLTALTIFEEYKSRSSSLCIFHQSTGISPLLRPNILLSTLFSETHNIKVCFSCTVKKRSYPYKTIYKNYRFVSFNIFISIFFGKLSDNFSNHILHHGASK
jgi:hypothetical protein